MREEGHTVSMLHGDQHSKDREAEYALFLANDSNTIVCTDICSRGIDIPDIAQVSCSGARQCHASRCFTWSLCTRVWVYAGLMCGGSWWVVGGLWLANRARCFCDTTGSGVAARACILLPHNLSFYYLRKRCLTLHVECSWSDACAPCALCVFHRFSCSIFQTTQRYAAASLAVLCIYCEGDACVFLRNITKHTKHLLWLASTARLLT